jgi:CheY-like chemotaxis protein
MLGRRLDGLRLLWIDDDPSANRIEIRMFQQLGMQVELATSTGAALERLMKSQFHLVLSDIDREGRGDEGIRALPMIRKMARGAPVIFYVAKLLDRAPPPGGALGITNDPEELLELVLDGVEGKR